MLPRPTRSRLGSCACPAVSQILTLEAGGITTRQSSGRQQRGGDLWHGRL